MRSRRWLAVWVSAWSAVVGTGAGAQVRADEDMSAFASFSRPAPRERTIIEPLEWQRLGRSANSFGPPVLRPLDEALLAALNGGDWQKATALLAEGASANARDVADSNPLEIAARAGEDALVRDLIGRGAELDRVGSDGFTPLGAAAFFGHDSTVRILLRAGADKLAWGATGNGPMHLAAMSGQVTVIDLLLKSGADPAAFNRQGDTALDVAANRNRQAVMQQLIDAGVDPTLSGR